MLVAFPIAFLTGAAFCAMVGWLADVPRWNRVGAWMNLAGIATALVAAVPGFLDYLFSVPPNRSEAGRVGHEGVSPCRSRSPPYKSKKKQLIWNTAERFTL